MKKTIAAFLAVVMVVFIMGCAPADKPESVVTNFCGALKNFDMETASSCFLSGDAHITNPYTEENAESQEFFTEQVIEYLTDCAKKMTYTFGEVTTEDDKAVVPVTFTYVDASPVLSATLGEYITQAFAPALGGADDSALEDLFGTIFMEKTESVETGTATVTVQFVCVKQGNTWKMESLSNDAQSDISNMISCNIVQAMEAFGEE